MNNNYNFLTPKDVVVSFFNLLTERYFAAAFNCLTPAFKENWNKGKGDEYGLDRFTKGYFYTVSIENVTYETIKQDEQTAEAHVNYTDNIQELRYERLEKVIESETNDLEEVAATIGDFCDLLIDLNGDEEEIKKIRNKHFFKPNAVETCLWLANADYSRNDELFTKEPKTLQQYRRALTEKTDNGWLIQGLRYS